jgi:serine/threonine protein kinase
MDKGEVVYAAKVYSMQGVDLREQPKELARFKKELSLMYNISRQCKQIVNVRGVAITDTKLILLMEYVEDGSLRDLLNTTRRTSESPSSTATMSTATNGSGQDEKSGDTPLTDVLAGSYSCELDPCTAVLEAASANAPEATSGLSAECIVDILLQVASGMRELHNHEPPIYHRDLKASNVLRRSRQQERSQPNKPAVAPPPSGSSNTEALYDCMITDFGVSTSAASLTCRTITDTQHRSVLGTPAWSSPEHLLGKSRHEEGWTGGVWSFGVLAWELVAGEVPWQGYEPMQVCFALVRGQRLRIPCSENLPGKLRELILSCWKTTPMERPSFQELVEALLQLQGKLKWGEDENLAE